MGQKSPPNFPLLGETEGATHTNMTKTYVSPLMVEVNVEAEQMLAASLQMHSDKTVDTSNGGQLSGDRRGEWGNLW